MKRLASTKAWFAATLGGAAMVVAGCNTVPIENLEDSFTLTVKHSTGSGKAVAIDFLWMVDNSTSMCEEQFELSKNFDIFRDKLTNFFAIDPRVGVTTSDMQCDLDAAKGINASRGILNTIPASKFPASCYAKDQQECTSDAECAPAGEEGLWKCKQEQLESCIVNPNGSINTSCRRTCQSDEECQQVFNDPEFICLTPGDSPEDWGCLRPPTTTACPDVLPSVLTGEDLDQFSCLATVGVYADKCFKYEQGLRGAMTAIDPKGPNADQAAEFLREDAYLVVIFVSDEDDCSTPDGVDFKEDFYNTCALQPTTDELCDPADNDTDCNGDRGKLVPVTDYINRFKALKADPSRVIVAAIAGDAQLNAAGAPAVPAPADCAGLTGEAAEECIRAEFFESKGDKKTCHQRTYVCSSEAGIADYGSRYRDLANGFGFNGLFRNICSPEGFGPALDEIADKIIQVVQRVCLPKPIPEDDLGTLRVVMTENGVETTLEPADDPGPNQYKFYPSDPECKDEDTGALLPAISFGQAPEPQQVITIQYKGDPQLGL